MMAVLSTRYVASMENRRRAKEGNLAEVQHIRYLLSTAKASTIRASDR